MSQEEEVTSVFRSREEELFSILRKIYISKAKMNPGNDSVVICDTPSPAKATKWMDSVMTDYRKRLRSSSSTNLLGTVYESPLMHFKRSKITDADTIMELNDVTIMSSPSSKKCRPKAKRLVNLDESVVIVNDTPAKKGRPVVELGLSDTELSDVVEVPEPSDAPRPAEARVSPKARKRYETAPKLLRGKLTEKKSKKARKKLTNLKDPRNLKIARAAVEALNVNDENHDGQIMDDNTNNTNECSTAASGDAGDVEVVWVSGPEAAGQQQLASADNPFVIDTAPSLTNLVNAVKRQRHKPKRTGRLEKTKKKLSNHPTKKSLRSKPPASANAEQQQPQSEHRNSDEPARLREIVIDGPNVGMGYLCGKGFSEKGLQLVVDYFKSRGHPVKVFLPQYMRTKDRTILERLYREGTAVFTPSRYIGGKMIAPYDDRYILDYATQCNGIVISSDQYRDLWQEKPQWRDTIENRLLTPTFAGNYLMFPEDPLGRTGPKLDEFLRY